MPLAYRSARQIEFLLGIAEHGKTVPRNVNALRGRPLLCNQPLQHRWHDHGADIGNAIERMHQSPSATSPAIRHI